MCKVIRKTSLIYEEALVSEKHATEEVKQFPKELIPPALRVILYRMLSLKDLTDAIAEKLQEQLLVGAELYGKKDDGVLPCKILKLMQEGVDKVRYEVACFDRNKNIVEKEEASVEDLVQEKLPFSRSMLKSFIRESTYWNAPWVVHDKLVRNHGISNDFLGELRGRVFFKNGLLIRNKKRKIEIHHVQELKGATENLGRKKSDREKFDSSTLEKENDQRKEELIKYPIDDLLVRRRPDDSVLTDRPSPSRDFNVILYRVGDLLMWPYSLEDFENAICHKDSNVVLLAEPTCRTLSAAHRK